MGAVQCKRSKPTGPGLRPAREMQEVKSIQSLPIPTGAWLIILSLLCNQSSGCKVHTFLLQSNFNIHPFCCQHLIKETESQLSGKVFGDVFRGKGEGGRELIWLGQSWAYMKASNQQNFALLYQQLCKAVSWFVQDRSVFVLQLAGVRQEPHQAHSSRGTRSPPPYCATHPPLLPGVTPPMPGGADDTSATEEFLTGKIEKRAHQGHSTHKAITS